MSRGDRFLVTGGNGFFGAWIARRLLEDGAGVAIFDLERDDHILQQVLDPEDLPGIQRLEGDVTDAAAVDRAVEESAATHILHLAGLQVPTCRADPVRGARVNVLGTLHVFEAVKRRRDRIRCVAYASSAAVAGPPSDYAEPIPDTSRHSPRTHYGVYKTANEGSARVYWEESRIPSVGLRPLTVYGVGREVGITSGPTKAIKAALLGRDYTIGFSGLTGFHYAEDVAAAFVACARARPEGALALNLRGELMEVSDFVRVVESVVPGAAGRIGIDGPVLPIACDFLQTGLDELVGPLPQTPAREGVRRTAERFRELLALDSLPLEDLEA